MKNIEFIDDNRVRIDGVLFTSSPLGNPVPEPNKEPVFKKNMWAAWVSLQVRHPFYITRIKGNDVFGKYDYVYNEDPNYDAEDPICFIEDLVPVSKDEIKEHLIKIAKDKGFMKDGVMLENSSGEIFHFDVKKQTMYDLNIDALSNGWWWLYRKGKWATIVPEKKKLPKTKEEFAEVIKKITEEYLHDSLTDKALTEFLLNYED